jgi:hypothetical protein
MTIARREFLKATSAAAGATALSRVLGEHPATSQRPEDVRITDAGYRPLAGYPIQPQRFSDVRLTDTFWKPKVDLNAAVTIPLEVRKFVDGEREFGGNILEAAILSLKTHPNPTLQAQVDAQIRATTQSAGRGNNGFEVAATLFTVTGRRDLLDRAIAAADVLYEEFTRTNPPFSGGERDAINCVQLYRVTHDRRHLDLAKHYLDIRGLENSINRSRHNQSYRPVLEQREAVGHAVNCASLMVSLTDVGALTGLKPYLAAAQAMWADAVTRKMYITGGIGTTGNEGFGDAYALPNLSAYAETCAVLMFAGLNHRLFLATGDSKYIDVMERGIYNNALSGVSAGGDRFFYVNRLASAGGGRDLRWERASLECCPPNLVRFLASMPGLVYAQGPTGAVYVNLYVSSESTFAIGAERLSLAVRSEMPWGGRSTITLSAAPGVKSAVKLRIPGWARNQAVPGGLYSYAARLATQATVSVNGARTSAAPDALGYVSLERVWKSGDVIEVDFSIAPRRVVADARVEDARDRTSVERGPIVYCAEWPDVDSRNALELLVDSETTLETATDRNLFGGVTTIRTRAGAIGNPSAPAGPITLVPYYLWANRGAGEMSVWLRTREYAPGDVGPAGGLIFYVNPNDATDRWRYLEAAPFDQSAGAPWGCFRQLIGGARGTAVGTGRQNTRDMLAACPDPQTAAALCANLTVNGVGGWFLPSRDELALVYRNLKVTGAVDFGDTGRHDNVSYWASSQLTADMAAHIDFADLGRQHFDDKDFPRRVRAIRAF